MDFSYPEFRVGLTQLSFNIREWPFARIGTVALNVAALIVNLPQDIFYQHGLIIAVGEMLTIHGWV